MFQAVPSYQQEHENMLKAMSESKTIKEDAPTQEPIKASAPTVAVTEPVRAATIAPIKEAPIREAPIREAPIREAPIAQVRPAAIAVEPVVAPVKAAPVKAKRATRAVAAPKPKGPPPIAEPDVDEEGLRLIRQYVRLDDEIIALKARKKEMEATLAQLEVQVRAIIQPLNAPVKSGTAVLRVKTKQVKESVTKGFITAKLAESGELKDPTKAAQIVENIYKSCKVKEEKQELCRNKK